MAKAHEAECFRPIFWVRSHNRAALFPFFGHGVISSQNALTGRANRDVKSVSTLPQIAVIHCLSQRTGLLSLCQHNDFVYHRVEFPKQFDESPKQDGWTKILERISCLSAGIFRKVMSAPSLPAAIEAGTVAFEIGNLCNRK